MVSRLRWLFGGMAVCALILAATGLTHGAAVAVAPTPTRSFEEVCNAVLTRAIAFTEQRCADTGRNEACYGYTDVTAAFQAHVDADQLHFDTIGDIVPLDSLARIETQSLNVEEATWGMAILKLQANLPATNPGQNVTFLLFGKTSLLTSEAQTNAFYLSTELGQLSCNQIPSSSLVVRAPGRVEVAFTLNDVQIRLASTLVFSAEGSMLHARVLEGHARITAGGVTQELVAGQELVVPLDPATGAADGPPSEPVIFTDDPAFNSLGALVDSLSGEPQGGPITLQGPIELIDLDGGWITVDGRRLRMDPAALARLRLGQQFTFTGYLDGFSVVRPPQGAAGGAGGSATRAATPDPGTSSAPPPPPQGAATPTATFTLTPTATDPATSTATETETATPTDTDTVEPSNTPTDTLEPSSTPTETATNTPVAGLEFLWLVGECSPDPASYRVWTVHNPNAIDVAFSWRARRSGQTGTGTAPANGTIGFTTLTEQGSNTVELWANGELNDSRSGNADQCP